MLVSESPPPVIWLTKQEAIKRSRFSRATIQRAMAAGELEYSGGGGRAVRIRADKLDEWLDRRGPGRER